MSRLRGPLRRDGGVDGGVGTNTELVDAVLNSETGVVAFK